jgi:hypothetical protein
VSGDADLIRDGLRLLRAMNRFEGSVPRGAQTWEIPLHTPDVLASAHLVRVYTLGYELTGEPDLLRRARHWAWTGVPFVYLVPPAPDAPIGTYATIAVLGATQWTAPVWIGLPVQWCGLVYADALYRLRRHDARGPWQRLADGITASGLQQTWPRGSDPERQGLLPDAFALEAQQRIDVAINPGTVQSGVVRLHGRSELYDFRAFPDAAAGGGASTPVFVHAPGEIADVRETRDDEKRLRGLAFTVRGWPRREGNTPYYVLVSGLAGRPTPRARVDGREPVGANAPEWRAG